jgi:hypothetical protein
MAWISKPNYLRGIPTRNRDRQIYAKATVAVESYALRLDLFLAKYRPSDAGLNDYAIDMRVRSDLLLKRGLRGTSLPYC